MQKKYISFLLSILVCLLLHHSANAQSTFALQDGDLIFQEACNGGMSSAIKEATRGIDGYNFTHVGIVWV
ncbi:hypothetical protein SASC598O02_001490 [Snodgrassella alvi SCGC AB-598-O02]|nr:hypothetical protein SASC598O02_001490 [Snodgrassella alvi SCGC AB-598-O02]